MRKEKNSQNSVLHGKAPPRPLASDVATPGHENELLFGRRSQRARGVNRNLTATLNRAGPSALGNPELSSRCRRISSYMRDEVGQALCGCPVQMPGDGASSTALRSARSTKARAMRDGKIAARPLHIAGSLAGGPLERQRAACNCGCMTSP